MPIIELGIDIHAPIEAVFDLARNIDAHVATQVARGERAVAGRTAGLIELGESVTWEAVHFGIRQRLTSKITAMRRPTHFCDSMVDGAFAAFDHDHHFELLAPNHTRMRDIFNYRSPLGVLGKLADWLVLERYMRTLLAARAAELKLLAERAH